MDRNIQRISTIADQCTDMERIKTEAVPPLFDSTIRRKLIEKRLVQAKEGKGRELTEKEANMLTAASKRANLLGLLRQSSITREEVVTLVCQMIAGNMPKKIEGQSEEDHDKALQHYFDTLEGASAAKSLTALAEAIEAIETEHRNAKKQLAKKGRGQISEIES